MESRTRPSKLLCLVSVPDKVLAVEVDRNADGKEVLNGTCKMIGTVETDFFGLQYESSSGELLWLNLRNRLTSELDGSSPYRLKLCIKFSVELHFIQQEVTRNLFYANVRQDFIDGILRINNIETVVNLASLLAHADHGTLPSGCSKSGRSADYAAYLPLVHNVTKNIDLVRGKCQQLTMSRQTARMDFLREVTKLETYGMHVHHARDDEQNVRHIGIGPQGITLYNKIYRSLYSFPYSALKSATCDNLDVDIAALQDDGSFRHHRLTLDTKWSASALYRDLTEMCSFFHFDTVESAVAEQFCRDLKGLIVSLFNERSNTGKKYLFDIERTLHEACDHARRVLYSMGVDTCDTFIKECATDDTIADTSVACDSKQHLKAAQTLQEIADALTCHVCKDSEINTAFVPCGHVVCCTSCARGLPSCPVCKQVVDAVQVIFLPSARPIIPSSSVEIRPCVEIHSCG